LVRSALIQLRKLASKQEPGRDTPPLFRAGPTTTPPLFRAGPTTTPPLFRAGPTTTPPLLQAATRAAVYLGQHLFVIRCLYLGQLLHSPSYILGQLLPSLDVCI
jgi:hypothetical protein